MRQKSVKMSCVWDGIQGYIIKESPERTRQAAFISPPCIWDSGRVQNGSTVLITSSWWAASWARILVLACILRLGCAGRKREKEKESKYEFAFEIEEWVRESEKESWSVEEYKQVDDTLTLCICTFSTALIIVADTSMYTAMHCRAAWFFFQTGTIPSPCPWGVFAST